MGLYDLLSSDRLNSVEAVNFTKPERRKTKMRRMRNEKEKNESGAAKRWRKLDVEKKQSPETKE
jgi:hypothetical protein